MYSVAMLFCCHSVCAVVLLRHPAHSHPTRMPPPSVNSQKAALPSPSSRYPAFVAIRGECIRSILSLNVVAGRSGVDRSRRGAGDEPVTTTTRVQAPLGPLCALCVSFVSAHTAETFTSLCCVASHGDMVVLNVHMCMSGHQMPLEPGQPSHTRKKNTFL